MLNKSCKRTYIICLDISFSVWPSTLGKGHIIRLWAYVGIRNWHMAAKAHEITTNTDSFNSNSWITSKGNLYSLRMLKRQTYKLWHHNWDTMWIQVIFGATSEQKCQFHVSFSLLHLPIKTGKLFIAEQNYFITCAYYLSIQQKRCIIMW